MAPGPGGRGFGLTTRRGQRHEHRAAPGDAAGDRSRRAPAIRPASRRSLRAASSPRAAAEVDACFGDSGGPLYIDVGNGAALIGVVSRGSSSPGEPCGGGGVYVRADKVVAWIQKTTGRKLDADQLRRAPRTGRGEGEGAG